MVSAARSDKDGDNQTQRRPGATQQDVGVEHRLSPEVELFARFDGRINRAVLVVQRDVFQRPRRHDAVIRAVSAREPCTPKNHSRELKITYAQPTTLPIAASGVEIESMMIWWKLLP